MAAATNGSSRLQPAVRQHRPQALGSIIVHTPPRDRVLVAKLPARDATGERHAASVCACSCRSACCAAVVGAAPRVASSACRVDRREVRQGGNGLEASSNRRNHDRRTAHSQPRKHITAFETCRALVSASVSLACAAAAHRGNSHERCEGGSPPAAPATLATTTRTARAAACTRP